MKNRRIFSFFLLIVFVGISFSGCVNKSSEIKSRLIIQGIGVDRTDAGKYKLSIQAFDTSAEDEKSSESVTKVYTTQGDSVADAMRNITLTTGKRPLYSHNWIVVVSRKIAETGVLSVLDYFVRDYGMRSTVSLLLSEKSAEEIIRSPCGGAPVPAKEIHDSLEMWKYNAKTVNVEIYKAMNMLNDPQAELYLPIARQIKGETEENDIVVVDSLGVFKGQYLKGELPAREIRGFMFLNNQVKSGSITVEAGEYGDVSVEIIKSKTKTNVEINNGKPRFDILIKCVCDINEIENTNAALNKKAFSLMEKKVSEEIEKQVKAVLERCVNQYNCDVFRFGDRFLLYYPHEYKKMGENWDLILPNVSISVSAVAQMRRIGQKTAYPKM